MHTYSLHGGTPYCENEWLVIDEENERIAFVKLDDRRAQESHPWSFSVSAFDLPQPPLFTGHARSVEEALAEVKRLWPICRAQYDDEIYEAARRRQRQAEARAMWWTSSS